MTNIEHIIATAAEMGAANVMVALGMTSGEISSNKAAQVYGKWFKEAAASNRIKPIRVGTGKTGTKWYKVTEILALKTSDTIKAKLKF